MRRTLSEAARVAADNLGDTGTILCDEAAVVELLVVEFLAAPVSRSDVGEPLCISPDKRCATPWVAELDTFLVICAALKDSLLAVALVSDC